MQDVVFVELQVSVDADPEDIADGLADIVTLGIGVEVLTLLI